MGSIDGPQKADSSRRYRLLAQRNIRQSNDSSVGACPGIAGQQAIGVVDSRGATQDLKYPVLKKPSFLGTPSLPQFSR